MKPSRIPRKLKTVIIAITILLLIFNLGGNLNPFDKYSFRYHDISQPARVLQFSLNLKQGKFPPRLAPDFSWRMGYPVFNFYAPFAYWVTSFFNLLGLSAASSIELSFLLAMVVSFMAMFLFLNLYFDFFPSLLGGIFYVSSPYFAVEIFVRGNLGEVWFMALFPLSLYLIKKNSQREKQLTFIFTALVLSFLFTVHNIFSLLSLIIVIIFSLFLKNKKKNLLAIFLGLLLGSYFFLPALLESNLTLVREVIRRTNYRDHFLCLRQLWNSPWGYGGSVKGCQGDGMSFKLGKIEIVFALLGMSLFLKRFLFPKNKFYKKKEHLFIFSLTGLSIFLTTYSSSFIWGLFKPLFSLFQFPWRFLILGLFGLSFFSAFYFAQSKIFSRNLLMVFLILAALFVNKKYFTAPLIDRKEFNKKYLSSEFITKKVVYRIPEYLPRLVDYNTWLNLKLSKNISIRLNHKIGEPIRARYGDYQVIEDKPFEKAVKIRRSAEVRLNIHYFPFWYIYKNNRQVTPKRFDDLGRPIIKLAQGDRVGFRYRESSIELIGSYMSLFGIVFLIYLVKYKLYG